VVVVVFDVVVVEVVVVVVAGFFFGGLGLGFGGGTFVPTSTISGSARYDE
jgi:hypothetical protein